MKDVYMQIREKYGDQLPEDFSLAEYMLKKQIEDAEQQEIFEKLEREKASANDAKDTSGSESSEKV
jgi:predicted nuclease with TOPRIM domain